MTKQTFMLRRMLLLLAAASVLVPTAPARAGAGSRVPSNFGHFIAHLAAGDQYRFDCGFPDGIPKEHAFMEAFTSTDGTLSNAGWFAIENDSDLYISARVGDTQLAYAPAPGDEFGTWTLSQEDDLVAETDGVLRAAWAGWAESYTCGATINGVPHAGIEADPARAVYASSVDFGGGAGLDTTLAGAALNGSLSRTTNGYLFAGFTTGFAPASISIDGPDGEHFAEESPYGAGLFVARPSSGAWHYEVEHAVTGQGVGPLLVIMELPA